MHAWTTRIIPMRCYNLNVMDMTTDKLFLLYLETPPDRTPPQPEIPPGGPAEMPPDQPPEIPEPAPVEIPQQQPPEIS